MRHEAHPVGNDDVSGERSSDTCLEQEAAHPDPGANGSYARPCLVLFFQSLLLLICS